MQECCRGAAAHRSSAGAGGTGGAPLGKAVANPACPELQNPSWHPGAAAGSAPCLSSVLPFKQSSLAVMVRSHGDEQ